MKEENDKIRLSIILLLSIIASIFMLIFTIPSAKALEIISPTTNKVINNTTYYGYEIPTRVSNGSYPESFVYFGTSRKNQDSTLTPVYQQHHRFLKYDNFLNNDIEGDLYNYANDNNIEISTFHNVRTTAIPVVGNSNPLNKFYWVNFGFHLGEQASTDEMLSNGYRINYNNHYTYKFDMIVFDKGGKLGIENTQSGPTITENSSGQLMIGWSNNSAGLTGCIGPTDSDSTTYNLRCYEQSRVDGVSAEILYNNRYLQYVRYTIDLTQYNLNTVTNFSSYFKTTSDTISADSPAPYGSNYYSNSWMRGRFGYYNSEGTYPYVFLSEPYDITMWTTNSSEFCQDTCWTQSDTDNAVDSYQDDDLLSGIMSGINGLLSNDRGFSGIVNKTFSFIDHCLTVMRNNTSCYVVKVTFFEKDIILPCGSDFWNRQSVSAFVIIYNTILTGAVAYLVTWKIYKDLLSVISGSTNVVNSSEVDSL